MILFLKQISICSFLFFAINCKSKNVEPIFENNPKQLQRVWMLVGFQNFKKEDLIKVRAQMNLTDIKNNSASMGCNKIGFQLEIKKNKLKFINIIQTEMFCDNKMELENAFSKSLLENYTFDIIGQKLIITDSKQQKLVFVAQDWD